MRTSSFFITLWLCLCVLCAQVHAQELLEQEQPYYGCDMEFVNSTRGVFVTRTWPNGIIPFIYNENVGDSVKTAMEAGMARWSELAAVRFVAYPDAASVPGPGYLEIFHEPGRNSATVGYTGRPQTLHISSYTNPMVVMHELAHTLGLWHEQNRWDRNDWVRYYPNNVESGRTHNFTRRDLPTFGIYDFSSIMQYHPRAFGINNRRTLEPIPELEGYLGIMGNRRWLSRGDRFVMSALYPANDGAVSLEPSTNQLYARWIPGESEQPQTAFTLTARGNQTVAYELQGDQDWLPDLIAGSADRTGTTHQLTMDAAGLADGIYNGTLRVVVNGATAHTLAVQLIVGPRYLSFDQVPMVHHMAFDSDNEHAWFTITNVDSDVVSYDTDLVTENPAEEEWLFAFLCRRGNCQLEPGEAESYAIQSQHRFRMYGAGEYRAYVLFDVRLADGRETREILPVVFVVGNTDADAIASRWFLTDFCDPDQRGHASVGTLVRYMEQGGVCP